MKKTFENVYVFILPVYLKIIYKKYCEMSMSKLQFSDIFSHMIMAPLIKAQCLRVWQPKCCNIK